MKYALVLLSLVGVALAMPQLSMPQLPNGAGQPPVWPQLPRIDNIIGNTVGGIGDVAQQFMQEIFNATKRGINIATDFTGNVHITTAALLREGREYAEAIGNSFDEFLHQSVDNFVGTVQAVRLNLYAQINTMRNRVIRQALIDSEHVLAQVGEQADQLQKLTQELRTAKMDSVAEEQQAIQLEWTTWGDSELQAVAEATGGNADVQLEAETIIREVVDRYSSDLAGCADELETELLMYEERVHELIETYQPILELLIEQVQTCLENGNGVVASMRCSTDTRKRLMPLKKVVRELLDVNREGANLLAARLLQRVCVLRTTARFQLEKIGVKGELLQLIEDAELVDGSDNNSNSSSNEDADSSSPSDSNNSSGPDSDGSSGNDSDSSSGSDSDRSSSNDADSSSSSESDSSNSSESDSYSSSENESNADSQTDP